MWGRKKRRYHRVVRALDLKSGNPTLTTCLICSSKSLVHLLRCGCIIILQPTSPVHLLHSVDIAGPSQPMAPNYPSTYHINDNCDCYCYYKRQGNTWLVSPLLQFLSHFLSFFSFPGCSFVPSLTTESLGQANAILNSI